MAEHQRLDDKDVELWANMKLSTPWSGCVLTQLDEAKLRVLVRIFSKGRLDQLVKVRLLLACVLLPPDRKAQLSGLLSDLAEAAQGDEDEFVRATALSCGDFSGQLDLSSVMAGNAMVSMHACCA